MLLVMAQEMFQKYFSGLQFLNFIDNVMFFFADVMSYVHVECFLQVNVIKSFFCQLGANR